MRILAISDNFTGPEGFEEIRQTFLVIVFHMVGGFDFNGNSDITDNRIDLKILIGLPIGNFLKLIAEISGKSATALLLYTVYLNTKIFISTIYTGFVSPFAKIGNIYTIRSGRSARNRDKNHIFAENAIRLR